MDSLSPFEALTQAGAGFAVGVCMRVRSGVVGLSLMLLSALAASSANTRTAEARSSSTAAFGETDADRAPQPDVATVFTAEAEADADAAPEPSGELTPTGTGQEIITPPPADLRLENPRLRRMHKSEITPGMLALAGSIVRRHHGKPVGTQVEVEIEGKRVFARIERHFHPEGGPVKPWGHHPGVSLFVARQH